MPKVAGKKYAYDKAGKEQAKRDRRKLKGAKK